MLHSIETRNFVAEFYTSVRNDACGSGEAVVTTGPYAIAPYNSSSTPAPSYKLDSIKLFNKHERFINGSAAVPIKTVFFAYTDTLCTGIPNTVSGSGGKLTLSKIYFKYGNSQKSMISPYQFAYGFNPAYDLASKDRWGNYKPAIPIGNYEYPFVNQGDSNNDLYASAWSLTRIGLPSGGVIEANYESDDYAYVQGKEANEMFMVEGVGSSPQFDTSNILYPNKRSPNLYFYFKRRIADEMPGDPIANYLSDTTLLYYNFNVKMRADKNKYEQIKGYTKLDEVGLCSDGIHAYVRVKPVDPEGGADVRLNPVSFTAINTGRYNIPQVMYPGSEPDYDILHAISNMFGNFSELASLFQNPIIPFVNKKAAQKANLGASFIRLQSPGLHKKGGGQRVKSLMFYDSWNKLSGGNEQEATYGKKYNYRMENGASSGVASYEPMIGGDENPLREPVPYHASDGRKWPPVDPVDLFQELPLGESLYPPGSVGYSKVTVSSIHGDVGKSSQGVDIYQFYTARDFPIYYKATTLIASSQPLFDFFLQRNEMEATQGFSLVMNDMHGKPKSVAHYMKKLNTGEMQIVSSQTFNYKTSGNLLDNKVKCLVYDEVTHGMKCVEQQLGIDADLTLDSREKDERTKSNTFNINLNVSTSLFVIVPIPFSFPWHGSYQNRFRSATLTKVVQQYGILDNIVTFNEGASVRQKNEIYDPVTGQVIVTSVDNEYKDKEYNTSIPAYWAYTSMGPAYENINYKSTIDRVRIDSGHMGKFVINDHNLRVGDELLFIFTDSFSGQRHQQVVWYMGQGMHPADTSISPFYDSSKMAYCYECDSVTTILPEYCEGNLLPRFPLNTDGWDTGNVLKNINFTVIRSGNRNMLSNAVESYTQLENPVSGGVLATYSEKRINISATTYCDSNTVIPHRFLAHSDSINPFVIGQRGIYRQLGDYTYVTPRGDGGIGKNGIFAASNFFSLSPSGVCTQFPYKYIEPDLAFTGDPNWTLSRSITKWSPFGLEIENRDATGNYSTAVFGYNEDLPVVVATNARQGEVIAEGFEDYSLLHLFLNLVGFNHSFIRPLFGITSLGTSATYNLLQLDNPNSLSIKTTVAHTGLYSLFVSNSIYGTGYYGVDVPVNTNTYTGLHSAYNLYYPDPNYTFSGNNEYLPFQVLPNKKYILSFWINDASTTGNTTDYTLNAGCGVTTDLGTYPFLKKTNIIDGWQQVEAVFSCSTSVQIKLPAPFYVDDMRIFPADANIKSFVYSPMNEKLMATLDENNFAKMYEYDQEGNLVRVKKETEKGIMTVSESRSNNPAQ